MKTKIAIGIAVLTLSLFIVQCGDSASTDGNDSLKNDSATGQTIIFPEPLPTNIVPGFHFPEDSNLIYQWLSTNPFDNAAIYAHSWGIWAGLTAQSGQVYQGDSLRIFETWLGIAEIQTIISDLSLKAGQPTLDSAKSKRTPLTVPSQLGHSGQVLETIDSTFGTGGNLFVSVSYNNPAAIFAIENSILKQDVLNTYYKANAIGSIPAFPNDAITLKPTYFAAKPEGNLIRIPVWPGEPAAPQAYGFGVWDNYVYADTTNSQQPGKSLVPVSGSDKDPAHMEAATCNLSDFIYFEMDAAMAAAVNASQSSQENPQNLMAPGDMAILVCMHVATKEISNWTWQSFYWDPNPSQPKFPGSNLSKPSQITGSAAHYSVTTAYSMLVPNQPISGGTNTGSFGAVIGYNPYLEAGFNATTFDSIPNAYQANYVYGMQTNCMSCHAYANYSRNVSISTQGNNPLYSTDQYVDLNDPIFKSRVQLDFAWSIIGNIIPSTTSK